MLEVFIIIAGVLSFLLSLGVVFFWLRFKILLSRNHLFRFIVELARRFSIIIAKKTFAPLSLSLSICARNAARAPDAKALKEKANYFFFCISLSLSLGHIGS